MVLASQRVDARRHRRREQHRLSFDGRRLQDRVDVVGEPHVEHLVGLVEDHRLDRAEMQRAATDVVECPAGRGDDDVHAAVERLQLSEDRLATVDRRDLDAELAAVLEDGFADLHRQLASRHQHQRDRHDLGGGVDHLQRRQRERRGLAGAGRCLAQQVLARQQVRDGLALDRCRFFVAEIVDRLQQFRAQAETLETLAFAGLG